VTDAPPVAASSEQNVAVTLGANIALAVLNAGTGILAARLLGPEGRGQLAAVQLWAIFLGTVSALGVPEAVVYFVARRKEDAGTYVASASVLNLGTSIVFTIAAWFVVPLLLHAQTDATKDLARVFVLVIPVFVLAGVPYGALRGQSQFRRWNFVRLLPAVMWLGIIGLSKVTGHVDVAFLAVGFMVMETIMLAVTFIVAKPVVRPPYRVNVRIWRPMLRYGLPGVLSTVPQLLNLRLDQLLLAAFVTNERLGLYVVGVAWAGMTLPILSALGSVVFPRLAGEKDDAARTRVLLQSIRLAALLALVVVAVVLVLTPLGLPLLFSAAFADAVPTAAVLVVAGGILAVNGVLEEAMRGLGRPAEVLWAELGGLAITGIALAALLRPLDILGAALASLLGYLATAAVLIVRLRAAEGLHVLRDLRPRGEDVRTLAGGLVGMARRLTRRTA
jgi:O-antigen/teichoic acid export membrane protein